MRLAELNVFFLFLGIICENNAQEEMERIS